MPKKDTASAAAQEQLSVQEDELNVINVMSIQSLQEAAQVQDLSQAVAVSFHGRNIVKIQALELCQNLRTLDLSFNLLTHLDGMPALTKLKELKLYDNKLTRLDGLSGLAALHTLDVSGNRLSSLQGLAGLRNLKVLRCAYNKTLSSLDGLGKAGGIESLDVSYCSLPDLTNLSSAVALKELVADGNNLRNLKGIQRCDQLLELRVADNALTSLQGLRASAATLEVLDVRSNQLTSIETLADNCGLLHELYASDNKITSLHNLHIKAPSLETLDVGNNKLAWSPDAPDTAGLLQPLAAMPELSWVYLEGNQGCLPGYKAALLSALPMLEGIDDMAKPEDPNLWVNPADAGPDLEIAQLVPDVDPAALLPTVHEIEQFKQNLGITSDLPMIGRHVSNQLATDAQHPPETGNSTATESGFEALTTSRSSRPAGMPEGATKTISRPPSARPGSRGILRPGSATYKRPGSAFSSVSGQLASQQPKDILMHARVPSSRVGGNAKLMTPEQYTHTVDSFDQVMEEYSKSLKNALSSIKAGLQLSTGEAAQQMRTPEGIAARQLPVMPVLPAMPHDMLSAAQKGSTANSRTPAKGQLKADQNGKFGQDGKKIDLNARREALRDPDLPAALEKYQQLFPDRKDVSPGMVKHLQHDSAGLDQELSDNDGEGEVDNECDRQHADSNTAHVQQSASAAGKTIDEALVCNSEARWVERDDSVSIDDREELICGSSTELEDECGMDIDVHRNTAELAGLSGQNSVEAAAGVSQQRSDHDRRVVDGKTGTSNSVPDQNNSSNSAQPVSTANAGNLQPPQQRLQSASTSTTVKKPQTGRPLLSTGKQSLPTQATNAAQPGSSLAWKAPANAKAASPAKPSPSSNVKAGGISSNAGKPVHGIQPKARIQQSSTHK